MKKKLPLRKCLACEEKIEKKKLIRVVCNKQGEVKVDKTGKAHGRGAYICNKEECFKKAVENKAFNKAFKKDIDDSVYEKVLKEIKGDGK